MSAETRTMDMNLYIGVEVGEDGVAQLPASFSTYISLVLQECLETSLLRQGLRDRGAASMKKT